MDLKALQLTLIRVYLGLDFIPHFAEKLGLLGPDAYARVLHYFAMTVPRPHQMVLLAGLCELGASIGFTFGLFTRVAAIGTTLYLVIALFAGHHQDFGFTWANPGGGWEFPALWAFFCLSFVLTGGSRWSVDRWLRARLPSRLRWLSI